MSVRVSHLSGALHNHILHNRPQRKRKTRRISVPCIGPKTQGANDGSSGLSFVGNPCLDNALEETAHVPSNLGVRSPHRKCSTVEAPAPWSAHDQMVASRASCSAPACLVNSSATFAVIFGDAQAETYGRCEVGSEFQASLRPVENAGGRRSRRRPQVG